MAVLHELYERERHIEWGSYDFDLDPYAHPETGFSMSPEQGDQLYLLARYGRATNVVEFATSLGFSTIFIAAALKEAGAGIVYSAELVPSKVEQARRNIDRAGLSDYVEILEGDAREALSSVPDRIDLAVIDGWIPAVSLEVLKTIEHKLRPGALVYNENLDDELIGYVKENGGRYRSMRLLSGSDYKPSGEVVLKT
ncbi:O-methyltransferase [Gordonia humi]|uniref:Putative O-methyltransferase YrrM n=1 Tax=Gordonia humi TaxID=686429 RepID=A0A840F4Y4_9ACTN|nr:class I SAM-dependent methyltransferase [Gordonia humi]MBB4135320.1 putative O-methyltransferase YrrM [Gordonia humi]